MRRYMVTVYLDVSGQPARWSTSETVLVGGSKVQEDLFALHEAINRLVVAGVKESGRFKVTVDFNEMTDAAGK